MAMRRRNVDKSFARFCRIGDPTALGDVFDRTAGEILRVALWLTRNRADAEELLQRTFLAAIETRGRFEPGRPAVPWLMGLLAREGRRLKRERARPTPRAISTPVVDPEAEAVAAELQATVREVRSRMPEPYRDVLELHLEQGLGAKEIAERLGRPPGTVRTQLMRALQLLRRRLPEGYTLGLAPLVPDAASLAMARAAVVTAAEEAAPVGAALVSAHAAIAGGMLVSKTVLVVIPLVLLFVVATYLAWPQAGRSQPSVMAVLDSVDGSSRQHADPPAPAPTAHERSEVIVDTPMATPGQEDEETFDPSPVLVPRWLARFLVVDPDEEPIEGARITIWPAAKVPIHPSMRPLYPDTKHAYSGREEEPLLELRTDAEGRASTVLELECCYAEARGDDSGRTGELVLWHSRAANTVTRFTLDAPVLLRGIVLHSDGSPAAGAVVHARASGRVTGTEQWQVPDPESTVADAEGRFAFPAIRHAGYRVQAELQGEKSFEEEARLRDAEPPEIVLRFPGAVTLGGIVVDPEGLPVADATVRAWREYDPDDPGQAPGDYESVRTVTGADGRFRVAVQEHARYQLLASAKGHARSALTWVETTPAQPHIDARLELLRHATIAGAVQRQDGSPLPGVRVTAMSEGGIPPGSVAVPSRIDLFPWPIPRETDEDGRFELPVQPGTTWTVVARPFADNEWLDLRMERVEPGTEDLVFEFTSQALAGCVVEGTVVRAADGKPVEEFEVELLWFDQDDQMRTVRNLDASIEGNRFVLPALALERRFAVRIRPPRRVQDRNDWAPMQSEPFVTTAEGKTWEARVRAWGELPILVVEADGRPAMGVAVHAIRSWEEGHQPSRSSVDAEGRAELLCIPGPHELLVFRDMERLHAQAVTVKPGPNPEVLVRLPTSESKGTRR